MSVLNQLLFFSPLGFIIIILILIVSDVKSMCFKTSTNKSLHSQPSKFQRLWWLGIDCGGHHAMYSITGIVFGIILLTEWSQRRGRKYVFICRPWILKYFRVAFYIILYTQSVISILYYERRWKMFVIVYKAVSKRRSTAN